MSTLTIRTANGAIRHTTEINIGSKRIRQLGGKDCVLLRFSLPEPVAFAIGDRCDIPGEGRFHLVETHSPTYNASTGGFDYELSMEPAYRLGANKVLALHPGANAETEFKFTATILEHLAVVSKCMEHHAIRYHDPATGTDVKYTFAADDTVKTDARYIQYSGHTIISALDAIASEWECEWWADGSVIRFGKCEKGDIITIERDVNVSDIKPSGRDPRRHTRLYAFGGTENIPPYYRRKMVFKVTRVDGSDIYDDEHPLTLDMISKATHTADPNASVRVNRSTAGTGSVTPSLTSGVFYTVKEESYQLQSMKHGTWRLALSKFLPTVSFPDGRPYGTGHDLRFRLEVGWTKEDGTYDSREFVSEIRYFPTPTDYTPTWQDAFVSLPVDSSISFKLTIDFMASDHDTAPSTIAYNTTSVPLTLSSLSTYDSAEGLDIDRVSPTGSAIAGVKFNALHKPVVGSMPLTLPAGAAMAVGDTFTIRQLSRLNIPAAWYSTPDGEPITDATATNRLRLPEDTPYVDAYEGLADTEAVECSHVFDDIYPRQDNTVSDVWPVDVTATDDDGATTTLRRYCLASTGLGFSEDDIIRDQELRVKFTSGLLNGMTFGVTWHPSGVVTESAVINDACFEIVASEEYGRRLPDTILRPQTGDKFILLGWASDTLFDQLLEAAEEELKEKAIEWQQEQLTQGETYDCPLIPSVAKEGIPAIGQRVKVVEPSLFPKGYHVTRVIGLEYPLDIPYDNPTIKIGDRIPSKRLDGIEERINRMGTIEDFSAPPSQEIDNIAAIISADLSNQADTVVFNDLGQIVGGLPSTTVGVWVDGVKASGVALSIAQSYPGLGFSIEGDTVRVSSADMTMPPRTEVEITATFAVAGRVTSRTLVFTVLMRRGDARYQLLPSATAIHVRPDKTLVPASGSLTCAVLMASGGEPKTLTPVQTRLIGLVLQWRVDEGSWHTWSETSGNPAYTDANSNIQWRLLQQGECIDIETIPFVVDGEDGKDGESPYLLDLSNEMDSVPCDAQGNVLSGVALPSTSFAVYVGSRRDTGWTFSTLATGCTASLDSAAGTLAVTAITADRATVKLMADKGTMSLEALFTVTKVRSGGRGNDAVIYRLHPSVDKVSRDKSGNATPASLYVNVAKTVGNAQIEVPESFGTVKYSIDGGAETALAYTATGKTASVTIGATDKAVTFYLYSANGTTLLDKERVPVIADGKDGKDGAGWVSDTVEYAAGTDGVTPPASGWQSTVPQGAEWLWTRVTTTYTVGTPTVSYSVSRIGKDGKPLTVSSAVTRYAATATEQQPADSAFTATSIADISGSIKGKYIWALTVVTYSDGTESKTYGVSRVGGDGASGNSMHMAYADSVTRDASGAVTAVSGFSITPTDTYRWIGVYTDTQGYAPDSTDWHDYAWKRVGFDYADFKLAGGLDDLAASSALQSAVGDLLRGSSPYTIEFSPSVVAVVNKTGAAWSRTVTLIANRIAAMQSVAGGTWSVVGTEGTDVTASVTGNQLTVGGKSASGKVTVRYTGPDLATCERTLSVGVARVTDGLPGKDMTYADFVAGGGIGALAANTDLISGVKSDIDTASFRNDIGVRIKSGVKDLLAGDSAFKSALKPNVTFDKATNKLLIDGVAASDSLKGGDGHSPVVTLGTDGYLVIDGTKQPTLLKGGDGKTPTIDPTTKKWKIGDTLTDVVAQGIDGTSMTYADFKAGGGLSDLAGNSDLKSGVKGLLASDSAFKSSVKGDPGAPGDTWKPSVAADGTLSWSKNSGGTAPSSVNIKGTDGFSPYINSDNKWVIKSGVTNIVAKGKDGTDGTDGATFTPSVDASGNLSWSNNKGLANPATKNIKGDPGTPGNDGKTFRPSFVGDTLKWTASTDVSDVSLSGIAKTSDIKWSNLDGKPTWIGSTKPTYTASEVGVSLVNGKITIGGGSITPITSHQSLAGYAKTSDIKWSNLADKPTWIGASKPSYSYSEISNTPTIPDDDKIKSVVQQAGFVKYTNGQLMTCSAASCTPISVAVGSHNHDGVYSKLGHIHATVEGTYSGNGGAKNPNAYGKNRVGFYMSAQAVNGNAQYKDWILLDCYNGSDAGGAVAIGVNRQSLGAYIMRSEAARTAWAASAELIGTHNYTSYCAAKSHTHDDRYYTEAEVNSLVGSKLNVSAYTAADVLTKLKTVDGSGSGLDADTVDGVHNGSLTASRLNLLRFSSSTSDTSNLAIIKQHYTEIPAEQPCSLGLSHSSLSMAFGWRLGGSYNSVGAAYCGWFVSDYGTPRWIGADNGSWRSETFAFLSSTVANASALGGVAASNYLKKTDAYLSGVGVAAGATAASEVFVASIVESNGKVAARTRPISEITAGCVKTSGSQNMSGALSLPTIYVSNWLRTTGNAGWYSETYGGGWYMTDSTWIRNYANKNLYMTTAIIRTDGELQVGGNGDKFRVTSAGKATMTCAERDVLTIKGSASTGAAINLNNNGKQGIFGMNANGLWFQNLYGANQPYIQLLNDGGFVLDKGTAGRFDILHDGNIYNYVPRVIYSAAGNITSSGFAPFTNTLSPTAVSVTFSVPTTNRLRITLGSAIYPAKRLRCTVEPATFAGSLSIGMVGRSYGVSYLNASGAAVSDGNTVVKYIDIYCAYNGALAAPMGYAHITIMLLPPTL